MFLASRLLFSAIRSLATRNKQKTIDICLGGLYGPQVLCKLTLRTSETGILALCKLPCGITRPYTGFAQTSLWRRKPVYRQNGMSMAGVGRRYIPALLSNAYWHLNARVIEILTRQQPKNNFFP